MKLIFNIHYHTEWGESVYLCGGIDAIGGNDLSRAVRLDHIGGGKWSCELDVCDNIGDFSYSYLIKRDDGTVVTEWGNGHRFISGFGTNVVRIYDYWQVQPDDTPCIRRLSLSVSTVTTPLQTKFSLPVAL